MPDVTPSTDPNYGHTSETPWWIRQPGQGGGAGPNDEPEYKIEIGWIWIRDDFGKWIPVEEVKDDGPGGAGGSSSSGSSWSGQYVNDALSAAGMAIQAFLSGQSQADARKLAASEQFQSLAKWALPAGELPGGFQEGGAMQQMAAMKGRKNYMAPSRDSRQVNPGELEHPGNVSGGVMAFIEAMLGAADEGHVVTTGGSSQQSSSH